MDPFLPDVFNNPLSQPFLILRTEFKPLLLKVSNSRRTNNTIPESSKFLLAIFNISNSVCIILLYSLIDMP
jgi:hypothetical protein